MIRFALKVLAFIAGLALLLVGVIGVTFRVARALFAHDLTLAAAMIAIGVVVAGLCALLFRPGFRAFVDAQRRWRLAPRVAAWATAGIAGLFFAFLALAATIDAKAIRTCERAIFPVTGYCHQWYTECMKSGDCPYNAVWQSKHRKLLHPPTGLFQAFEKELRDRHVAMGWTDIDNPAHVRAVEAEWARAWEEHKARKARLLRKLHPIRLERHEPVGRAMP